MPGRPSNHQSPITCNYRQNTRLVNTGRKDFKPPGSQRVTAGMLLTAFLGQKEAKSFHTREYFWLLEIPFRTQAICEIHTVALPAATWLRVQLLMTTDYKQKKIAKLSTRESSCITALLRNTLQCIFTRQNVHASEVYEDVIKTRSMIK